MPTSLIETNRWGGALRIPHCLKEVVSAALVKEEEKEQWHVYYVSKRILDVETRYPELEKLALALVIISRKLSSYFHAHSIEVLTNYPLSQVIQKPKASRRILK